MRARRGTFVALCGLLSGLLSGLLMIPVLAPEADAQTGLVAQSTLSLAPGVTYSTFVDNGPRNVIHVTRISARARVTIKAVTASANKQGRTLALATTLCRQARAVACVNGDFFTFRGSPLGGVLVNGRWVRPPTRIQQQVWVDSANRFSIGPMPAGAVHSLGATNYAILRPGQPIAIPEHDAFANRPNARTIVGWNEAGDRFLVTIDQGRGSRGMSLAQAANLMRRLGATTAVNEDGGGSSHMVVGGVLRGAPGLAPRMVSNMWAVSA